MKRFLLVALLTVNTSIAALAQAEKTQSSTQDQEAVRKLMEDVAVAWNKHDAVGFSKLFAEDADFTNWRGTIRLHGREEIKNAHAPLFGGMFRQSKMTVKEARIRFYAPEIATVHCEWELVGTIDYDGKGTIPPRTYYPLFLVTKERGNWSISVMHNVLLQPSPPGAVTKGPVNR